ncbi:Pre-mRNA-processing factor 6 [Euphorbia peplus]|nr:Pre-mRNA-processing factor 6 [Euphorbia peplus]
MSRCGFTDDSDNGPALMDIDTVGGEEGTDRCLNLDRFSDLEISDITNPRLLLLFKNPKHPSSWIEAARFEEAAGNLPAARQLIQKGCEECSQNEDVWLEACRLASSDDDARRTLLHRAVQHCPLNLEFWLALARLETYDNAKRVLNNARMNLSYEPIIWITAAKLEETNGNTSMPGKIIARCIRKGLVIDRAVWIKEAEAAERAGYRVTCRAIIKNTIGIGVEGEENRKRTWVTDAEECQKRGSTETSRAILQEAYAAIPNSEEIWLAAFKLEFENCEPERARLLLAKARERGGTERVWMKSAIVERELGNTEEERRLLDEGLKQFPSFFKLWLMLGQLEERLDHLGKAKEVYELSLNYCSSCIQLWLSLANLEEKMTGLSKARAVLTMARKENPHNPELWLAAVRAESRHRNKKEAKILMTEALEECPNSGILWAASIEMVPRVQPISKCVDGIKTCASDPHVIVAVANLLWRHRKVDEARKLLNGAVTFFPDIGDFWALYYKFEIQHGTEEDQKDVLKWCIAAEPKHGERWQRIAKALENAHQQTETILTKVLVALVKEENAQKN